jgi:hypothetical protein
LTAFLRVSANEVHTLGAQNGITNNSQNNSEDNNVESGGGSLVKPGNKNSASGF